MNHQNNTRLQQRALAQQEDHNIAVANQIHANGERLARIERDLDRRNVRRQINPANRGQQVASVGLFVAAAGMEIAASVINGNTARKQTEADAYFQCETNIMESQIRNRESVRSILATGGHQYDGISMNLTTSNSQMQNLLDPLSRTTTGTSLHVSPSIRSGLDSFFNTLPDHQTLELVVDSSASRRETRWVLDDDRCGVLWIDDHLKVALTANNTFHIAEVFKRDIESRFGRPLFMSDVLRWAYQRLATLLSVTSSAPHRVISYSICDTSVTTTNLAQILQTNGVFRSNDAVFQQIVSRTDIGKVISRAFTGIRRIEVQPTISGLAFVY